MAKVNYIGTNFTSGEFSPEMYGRVDYAKYFNGAATIENMFIKSQGGIYRRPGSYFVCEAKYHDRATRMISFQFSTEQAYIIEVGDLYMRFYKDDGRIEVTGVLVEIVTPYTKEEVFDLQFAQSADVLYIAHKDHPQMILTRTSHIAWTIDEIDYADDNARPALMPLNTTATTITMTGGPTAVTLTASASLFLLSHIGSIWKIISAKSVNAPAWAINTVYTTANYVTYEGIIYKCISNHTSGTVFLTDLDAGKWSNQDVYVEITGFTSATVVTGNILYGDQLEAGSVATTYWYEGAWSKYRGYPRCVTFFEQRLYWAATNYQPQTIWGSQSENYYNMETGSGDSDAVAYTISDNQVNAIKWMLASGVLSIGTESGTFTAKGDISKGITPTSILVTKETSYGTSDILPKMISNYVFYIQRNNRTMRKFFYNFTKDAYESVDATIRASHILESGIVDMAYQEVPENIFWCVREDGELACVTFQIEEDIGGWVRFITDGDFKSVATIPNGEEDEVWVVVERTIGGAVKQYIEYFKPFIQPAEQEDCFYVDSGLTYDGDPTNEISGLYHLIGKEVALLTDGAVHPVRTVSPTGTVALDDFYFVVHAGLAYTSKLKTLRLEVNSGLGTSQGIIKRIYHILVRLYKSLNCKIGVEGNQDIVLFRDSSMDMDAPPPLLTGDKEITFPAGYQKAGQIYITQVDALPLNLLCIVSKVEIAEE
jgi:hypothetical protein